MVRKRGEEAAHPTGPGAGPRPEQTVGLAKLIAGNPADTCRTTQGGSLRIMNHVSSRTERPQTRRQKGPDPTDFDQASSRQARHRLPLAGAMYFRAKRTELGPSSIAISAPWLQEACPSHNGGPSVGGRAPRLRLKSSRGAWCEWELLGLC